MGKVEKVVYTVFYCNFIENSLTFLSNIGESEVKRFMRVLFQNGRYVTEGIKNKLHPLHQLLLWNFIDEMDVEQKYYFQSFNITGGVQVVEIEHIQDTPPYRAVHRLETGILTENIKVYVIDDGERSTMLLSNEY